MKKYLCLLIILSVKVIISQTAGWKQINSPTYSTIYSIYFVNEDTGFVSSSGGRIIKTTDGGTTWSTSYILDVWDFRDFSFINKNVGWSVSRKGCIVKTTDCGQNWFKQRQGGGYDTALTSVCFVDSLYGWAVGDAGTIRATNDGGVNWTLLQSNVSYDLSKVFFTDRLNGYVGGRNTLLHTTNGGINWQNEFIYNPIAIDINELYFWNNSSGFIYAHTYKTSYIFLTSDGGHTLDTLIADTTNLIEAASHLNRYKAWALQYGSVITTNNGWLNYDTQSGSPGIVLFADIFMVNDSIGYAGSAGSMCKTTSGGFPTSIIDLPSLTGAFELLQNYPNPFNPSTVIRYQLSVSGEVTLKIYDLLGREVATLVEEYKPAGTYEVEFNPASSIKHLTSGVYFYHLKAGEFVQAKKMLMLK